MSTVRGCGGSFCFFEHFARALSRSTQHLQPLIGFDVTSTFTEIELINVLFQFIRMFLHACNYSARTSVCINSVVLINFAPNESPEVCSRPGFQFHQMGGNSSQYFLMEGEKLSHFLRPVLYFLLC